MLIGVYMYMNECNSGGDNKCRGKVMDFFFKK